jgi:hypothetical protein
MRKHNSKSEKKEEKSLGEKLDRVLDDNSLTVFRLSEL